MINFMMHFFQQKKKKKKNERLYLEIQYFEKKCFYVNYLLIKHGLFLRIYELKDKYHYLIKQDSERKT